MRNFRLGCLVAMITFVLGTTSTTAQTTAKLNCLDYAMDDLEPSDAATLCREVTQRNVTSTLRCVTDAEMGFAPATMAIACQGGRPDTISAVWNCLQDGLEREMTAEVVAQLCQGVTYQTYTARYNCFAIASDRVEPKAAAILCGGQ